MSDMVRSGQEVAPRIRGEASYHVLSRAHMGPGSNFTSTLTSNASASLVFGFLAIFEALMNVFRIDKANHSIKVRF